jgi:hypothetical protein
VHFTQDTNVRFGRSVDCFFAYKGESIKGKGEHFNTGEVGNAKQFEKLAACEEKADRDANNKRRAKVDGTGRTEGQQKSSQIAFATQIT